MATQLDGVVNARPDAQVHGNSWSGNPQEHRQVIPGGYKVQELEINTPVKPRRF